MSAPELPHLPDLPNAGYSTRREQELSDSIMLFMRAIERDRLRLLTIVVEGLDRWRSVAGRVWSGFRINQELTDEIFHYFELQACRPEMQVRLLAVAKRPDVWRMLMAEAMPDIEAQHEQIKQMAKWCPWLTSVQ